MNNSELIELLSEEDSNILLHDINENGYYTPQKIITYINNNHKNNDYTTIDVDLIISIDLYTDYKIFITENDVYTKDQVMEKFKLSSFGLNSPEILFNNQQIEVSGSDYFVFDQELNDKKPNKLLNTKIYIGKEKWKDFMIAFRFLRSMTFISDNIKTIQNDSSSNKS